MALSETAEGIILEVDYMDQKDVGIKYTGNKKKEVEALNNEVKDMRKELDDVKEVLRGLIQVIMSRDDNLDEDEYN